MSRIVLLCAALLAASLFGSSRNVAADEPRWSRIVVPDSWKNAPVVEDGVAWQRTWFRVPDAWAPAKATLALESADDAREVWLNGKRLGAIGAGFPAFRSALGETLRVDIAPGSLRSGEWNVLAVKISFRDGRTNFNVAAPILLASDQGLRLSGTWETTPGDVDPEIVATFDASQPGDDYRREVAAANDLEREFRKLGEGDPGPQSPAQTLAQLTTNDDLAVDLVLSEPDIAQPLSMRWDARGRLWVVEYRQYPHPAGLTALSRDKFLRTVYDKTPPAPPNHERGLDRVSIHSDLDGDGSFERHQTFLDGLNLCSSIAIDSGGVWVLHPPYLLFYPDANQDDVPDGDPEVHLEGFGIEDSHSVASNLRWGPDGWLYGSQGSTVSGAIRRPSDPPTVEPIRSQGQLIWRYHPKSRKYEVFAEGGGNAFGVELDAGGRVFSGHNGGDTRGFHYVQGAYLQKGFGKHGALSNPYAFGYYQAMKHNAVARFTHCFTKYEGNALPERYRGTLFGAAPLQGHITWSSFERDGSTWRSQDLGHGFESQDLWVRPVDIQTGPDGAVYVADMYEQRIDHASHYQGRVHKESGRIYRIRSKATLAQPAPNLSVQTNAQLFDHLKNENRALREQTRWLLARREPSLDAAASLAGVLTTREYESLERLWVHHAWHGLSDEAVEQLLEHPTPDVRRWTVQLACDAGAVSAPVATKLKDRATNDDDAETRVQLAASARRLPVAVALPIVRELALRTTDASDPFQPLMLWWAIEAHSRNDAEPALQLFRDVEFWTSPIVREALAPRMAKRFVASGSREDLRKCARLLADAPADRRKDLAAVVETELEGKPPQPLPDELSAILKEFGGGSLTLRARRGDPFAIAEALKRVGDDAADPVERGKLAGLVALADPPNAEPTLLAVVDTARDEGLRAQALGALQTFRTDEVGRRVVAKFPNWPEETRLTAMTLLATRPSWSRMLVDAVASGQWEAARTPSSVVDALSLHADPSLANDVAKLWPKSPPPDAEALRPEIEQMRQTISETTGNPYAGKKVFAEQCGKCHRLFDAGGKIGPDLTQYKRDDLPGMLMNVLGPSLTIREGFESYIASTTDGRTLTGFIADQDPQAITLQGVDGQSTLLPRADIEELRTSKTSLMPEGLLGKLSPQQIRDLFAYLRMTQPLPE